MSARYQSRSLFSVLALCTVLAGGAFITSTDVGAQTTQTKRPQFRHPTTKATQVRQPSNPLDKARLKTIPNPCGPGWHKGGDGQCHMN
jgi:hypothetical protein